LLHRPRKAINLSTVCIQFFIANKPARCKYQNSLCLCRRFAFFAINIYLFMNQRAIFLQHIAQTSPAPLALEITKATGCFLYDVAGKEYLDIIGGISVCNIGHCHPAVIAAIKEQADKYLHVLVYGEFIQSPQVQYAKLLADNLPASLNSIFFTNSGAEATEGAMKLAKKVTGRTQIIAFKNAYHGSTQGALSVMGDEYWRNAFRPLLPDTWHLDYNDMASLQFISSKTACVIAETVQAESGIVPPSREWLQALRKKCSEHSVLLVLDEIQAGFGRTGSYWAFEQYDIVPDILLLGKALGAGMPLGAFIADRQLMSTLTENPVLGHITTFGGHPVSCAAGLAGFKALMEERYTETVRQKEELFRKLLVHDKIKAVRSVGLWMALDFGSFDTNKKIIDKCLENGLLTDWFLFAPHCLRIAPPLTITTDQIETACRIIIAACGEING